MIMVAESSTSAIKLEASVNPKIKALLQEAADLEGRTLDDFVMSTAEAEAYRVIERHRVLKLNREDSQAFVEAILNPQPPNDALKKAAKWYKQVMSD